MDVTRCGCNKARVRCTMRRYVRNFAGSVHTHFNGSTKHSDKVFIDRVCAGNGSTMVVDNCCESWTGCDYKNTARDTIVYYSWANDSYPPLINALTTSSGHLYTARSIDHFGIGIISHCDWAYQNLKSLELLVWNYWVLMKLQYS